MDAATGRPVTGNSDSLGVITGWMKSGGSHGGSKLYDLHAISLSSVTGLIPSSSFVGFTTNTSALICCIWLATYVFSDVINAPHVWNGITSFLTIPVPRVWVSKLFPSGSTSSSLSTWIRKSNCQCTTMNDHLPKKVHPTFLWTLLLWFDGIPP